MGVRHDSVNADNIDLNQIADLIADQRYEHTSVDLAAYDASNVNFTTTLQGGPFATIKVNVTAQAFKSWAKTLSVAAVSAALDGTVRRSIISGRDQDTLKVTTIPPSFFVASSSEPENTITTGLVVVEDPQGDGSCGDILTLEELSLGLLVLLVRRPASCLRLQVSSAVCRQCCESLSREAQSSRRNATAWLQSQGYRKGSCRERGKHF